MILKKILQFSLIFVINIQHNSCKNGVNINRFVHSVRFPFILRCAGDLEDRQQKLSTTRSDVRAKKDHRE